MTCRIFDSKGYSHIKFGKSSTVTATTQRELRLQWCTQYLVPETGLHFASMWSTQFTHKRIFVQNNNFCWPSANMASPEVEPNLRSLEIVVCTTNDIFHVTVWVMAKLELGLPLISLESCHRLRDCGKSYLLHRTDGMTTKRKTERWNAAEGWKRWSMELRYLTQDIFWQAMTPLPRL